MRQVHTHLKFTAGCCGVGPPSELRPLSSQLAAFARTSNAPNMHPTAAREASTPERTSSDGDSATQPTIDLTEADTNGRDLVISGPMMRVDTVTSMQVDVDDMSSNAGKDTWFQVQSSSSTNPHRIAQTKTSEPLLPTPEQPTCPGCPPQGLCRTLQPASQHSRSRSSSGVTVPQFSHGLKK